MTSSVPFFVTESMGGPYPDESFLAGWHLGQLNMALSKSEMPSQFLMPVLKTCQAQADLIAMRHGWQTEEIDEHENWSITRFRRAVPYMILDE